MKCLAGYLVVGLLFIGNVKAQERLELGGELTITNREPPLVYSGIIVGSGSAFDYGNRLYIRNGGHVLCLGSMYVNGTVSTGLDYDWLYSSASITGNGSLLDIGGDLRLGPSYLPGPYSKLGDGWGVPCHMEISGGAEVSVGGDISIQSRSRLNLGSGGRLTVGGDFQGDLAVHGTFAPGNSPADSRVDGALSLAPDGTLEMELGGYERGSEYDRLTVTGPSDLHGTLDLISLNNFSPTNGASFELFKWAGGVSDGQFVTITTNALSAGLCWDTSNLYTTGQLRVIPEPTIISLMAVFGGGLWVVRRYFPSV